MKVKELLDLIGDWDQETEVRFEFGSHEDYRIACSRLIADQPLDVDWRDSVTPMLEYLSVSEIKKRILHNEVTITLEQRYVEDGSIEDEEIKIAKLRSELKKGGES